MFFKLFFIFFSFFLNTTYKVFIYIFLKAPINCDNDSKNKPGLLTVTLPHVLFKIILQLVF